MCLRFVSVAHEFIVISVSELTAPFQHVMLAVENVERGETCMDTLRSIATSSASCCAPVVMVCHDLAPPHERRTLP